MSRVAAWLVPACVFALALAGCDALESNEDTKAKETLVGSWYWEHTGADQQTIKTVVTLAEGGSFTARERTGDQPREVSTAGPWYVTDGEFKLQTTEYDGHKLGVRQMLFFTCKLQALTAREFACAWGGGARKFVFKRVQRDFSLL